MALFVKQFIKKPLRNNNFVVADEENKEAVLIDCSEPDDEIMDWVKEQGLTLKYILLTHGHFDHVLGVNYYRKKYGVPAFLYEKDAALIKRVNEYTQMLGFAEAELPTPKSFDLNADFRLGKYRFEIIPTAGHTEGGVCYLLDKILFSGDTLFRGTYGRTDLKESDDVKMQQSLQTLFRILPDEIEVWPGHGAPTTIGKERALYEEV